MTLSDPDPRLSLAYSGHHDGVRFTCSPNRYGKGMVLSLQNDTRDMWKNRAAWLAEALNGHWARGHQEGFRLSNARAVQWKSLYLAGWDANVPMFKSAEHPVTFSLNNGPEMSLKEALKQIAENQTDSSIGS